MSAELSITDERLAVIATQGASMQVWEQRIVAAECLAHRIANKGVISRVRERPQLEPAPQKES